MDGNVGRFKLEDLIGRVDLLEHIDGATENNTPSICTP